VARLSHRDLDTLLALVGDIYQRRNLAAFRRDVLLILPSLVPSEITSYNEVDVTAGHDTGLIKPDGIFTSRHWQIFNTYLRQHPLIDHYSKTHDARALKISDFLSARQFHSLPLYNEFYRLLGIEHQLAVTLPARRSRVIGVALNRTRPDFTDRDRLCLNLLRPHLIQAYRNAEAVTELERKLAAVTGGMEALGCGLVLLNARNDVELMTGQAQRQLSAIFGTRALRKRHLPNMLKQWLREQERLSPLAGVPAPRKPLLLRCGEMRLRLRLVSSSSQKLLILENKEEAVCPADFEAIGLTRREAEVLIWICQGKGNPEIAVILGLSVRTIEKHVERILEKLGVETRTAAAVLARQFATGIHSPLKAGVLPARP
jgi:DNA-binding CsgD family transcriptional regulator